MKILKNTFSFLYKTINSHIKFQLFFSYVLIGVILLSILGGVLFYTFSQILTEKAYQYMEQLNEQVILNLDKNIYELEQISFLVNYEDSLNNIMRANSKNPDSYDSEYSDSYKIVNNYFFNLLGTKKEVHGLYIYTLNGENSYSINRELKRHLDVKVNNEPWFKETVKRKGMRVLSGLHENKFVANDSSPVVSVSRAIIDNEKNDLLGVIVVDQDIKYIGNIISNIKIGEKGTVIIVDEQNNPVYCNNSNVYEKISKQDEFKLNISKVENFSFAFGKGSDKIFAIQSISEHTGWKVITCTTYSDLMKDSIIIRNVMVVMILVCLVITFGVSIYISGIATKSLIKMKKLMEKVKEGNLDVKIEVKGYNEIADLESGFNSMVARIKSLIEEEYKEKLLRKEAELDLLQAQINPHFLYNTLETIKGVSKSEGSVTGARMIQSLSRIFRYNLSKTGSIVSIQDELDNLKNYLMLQLIRFKDRLEVIYNIDESTLNEKIPIMALQPIVENSIIHGFQKKIEKGTLQITIRHYLDTTRIYIIDNGIGAGQQMITQLNDMLNKQEQFINKTDKGSIGILNVNARLKSRFGNEYGLKLKRNSDEGICVEIIIPRTVYED